MESVCLNPFLIRSAFNPRDDVRIRNPSCLNPFLIRSAFNRSRPFRARARGGLNPFLIRSAFNLRVAAECREFSVLIPS